jgi:peptidoglycan LD-endopeptidase LytH
VPGASAVVAWLRDHSATLCDITALDLSTCALVYSDWSVTAADFIPPEQYDDAARFTARIWAEMRAAGAAAAIGGYDHIRPSYGGALFQADQAESRTVHIGLDIFMDAGTPLFAPLDGTVHSLAFNDAKFDYGPCVVLQHTVDSAVPVFYTLYGHLDLPSLAALHPGQAIRAGTQFARMGNFPENGDWPPHVHVQLILDMLDKRGDFNGSCKPSQRDVWLSLCPDSNVITRVPNALFPSVPVTTRCAAGEAATIVQRAGGWRYDACGQRTREP